MEADKYVGQELVADTRASVEILYNVAKFGSNYSWGPYAPVISKYEMQKYAYLKHYLDYISSCHCVLWPLESQHVMVSQRITLTFHPLCMYYSHWLSSLDLEKQLWYFSWQTRLKSPEIFVISIDFCALKLAYLSHQLKLPAIRWTFEYYFIVPIIFKWKCLTSYRLHTSMFHIHCSTFLYKVDKQFWTPNYALRVTELQL